MGRDGLMVTVAIGVIVVMVAVYMFPGMMTSLDDLKSDAVTQTVVSTTGVGETTEDVLLTDPLLDDNIANVTSVTSNSGTDTPVASTYTTATDTLTVSGLEASATRTLTIAFNNEALDQYTGMDDISSLAPFIIFIGLVLAVFLGIIWSVQKRRGA